MAFIDGIRELAESALELKDAVKNEAETKRFLIEPFLHVLGYKKLPELRLEYTVAVGDKKAEKVDYAIFKDGSDSPTILIECKAAGVELNKDHIGQLFRYFIATNARLGVLTNGLVYQFYTDLEVDNKMDEKPFLELNLLDIQDPLFDALEKFTKAKFDVKTLVETALEHKYTQRIKRILTAEYKSPTENFVNFWITAVKAGSRTEAKRKKFKLIIKDAFQQFVDAQIRERQAHGDKNEVALTSTTDSGQSDSTQTDDKGWKPLSELNPQEDSKPTEILFPDGKSVLIKKTWKAIMVEIVRWLIENKKLNESHCAPGIGRTKKSYLVATSPKHPTGNNFSNPEKIGSFYIQTSHGGGRIVQNIKYIIEYVGQDPAQFKVR